MVIIMDNKDLIALKQMMKEVISEELKPVNDHLEKIDQRLDNIEFDLSIIKGTTNALSEWAEVVSKVHLDDIHYPLDAKEKIS